jgi:negative regulator of flagellin synthesis FlgM
MEIKKMLTELDPYQKKLEKGGQADARRGRAAEDSAKSAGGDKVSLSSEARLRTEAHQAAQAAPDIRWDKVEAIKAKLASGEYEMDNRNIAEKILREDLDLFS